MSGQVLKVSKPFKLGYCNCGCDEAVPIRSTDKAIQRFKLGHNSTVQIRTKVDVASRFWSKVNKTDTCWLWTAGKARRGYGSFYFNARNLPAHRIAYELTKGKIPEGLTLDHLCRNTGCVNPDHLEPVTIKENLRRGDGWGGLNARKTHCPRGHPLVEGNLEKDRFNKGWRRCLTCKRESDREHKKRMWRLTHTN